MGAFPVRYTVISEFPVQYKFSIKNLEKFPVWYSFKVATCQFDTVSGYQLPVQFFWVYFTFKYHI